MKTDTMSNQLRWVILLLAAAVILPTVCLLWFMNQAVKNERLAVRQRLTDFYTTRVNRLFPTGLDNYFSNLLHGYDNEMGYPDVFFDSLASYPSGNIYQGALIYDSTGELIYPRFEFLNAEAAQSRVEPLPNLHLESTEHIHQLCYPENPDEISPSHAADIMRYRVFLAKRYQETKNPALIYHLRRILINKKSHSEKENGFLVGPAETTVWQLEKLIDIAQQSGLESRLVAEIQSARTRIIAYNNAIEIAPLYPSVASLQDCPNQTVRRLWPQSEYYGFKFNIEDKTILGISTYERMLPLLVASTTNIQDETIDVHISDNYGNVIIGNENITDKPFLTLKVGKYLPDFTVSLFFKDDAVFEKAARQQTTIYLWTGILVAVLILSAGVFSIRSVNHQIKMNRLKNDFIATVTHELKTPLASMRLLVDTLLEGNYESEKTATEYLQLVANENKRLTHLIDSFLTFSRMERNKQVFDFQPVPPAEIANAAVEAVQGKFNGGTGFQPVMHDQDSHTGPAMGRMPMPQNCTFSTHIAKDLPPVLADKDGMVTVLVNLLENAYKYTNGDKQIELKVYERNGCVCFAVKDNGIGLTPRAQKKIFNRFYQVDSRLSRRVEGCGLGLSIVKFIVDAHKGTIEVESKPDEGSVFTVKLPTL